jgi:hypothetical protein
MTYWAITITVWIACGVLIVRSIRSIRRSRRDIEVLDREILDTLLAIAYMRGFRDSRLSDLSLREGADLYVMEFRNEHPDAKVEMHS